MLKFILVLSLVGLLGYSGAQIVQEGQCNRDVGLTKNFDADKFAGTWYEIRRSASPTIGDCANIEISRRNDQSYSFTFNAVNRNYALKSSQVGTLEAGTAKFTLNLYNRNDATDFWIVATDYESHALAYRCENISPTERRVSIWQLGRAPVVNEEPQSAIRDILIELDIDIEDLTTVDYSSQTCLVLPVTGRQNVVLNGQCADYIPAVPNFDVPRFTGRWHQVSSYYSESSLGSCNKAEYALENGVVNVRNTEVIDNTLREISGIAEVASDNGEAKLNVVLNILPGVQASQFLWILGTDYENYAISYACTNVDNSTKQINSWILTRKRDYLSEASQQALNEIIDGNSDLSQENFIPTDQSEVACFYKPEPTEKPVIMPGQCGQNMPVVNNFNMAQFAGVWHEIQAYPKEQQTGQCINHEFTSGIDNILNLQSSTIYGIFKDKTDGVVSYNTTDNSARLILEFVSDGVTLTIPYWIITTDYIEYALAYSCVNIDDDFRAVYSWKLSRTKQPFSAAAINAFNDVFNSIQVLDEMYFKNIDQSDNACSFTAELKPNEPMILPGQCTENVPVVTNFEPARYLGLWYLIESYPSSFQEGGCNDATYTLQQDGSVSVYNTQVINEILDTINGTANVMESNDGSARLLVTFPNSPSLIYNVMATDYESYSVVYTCANINSDQKQIYSWKLSRTKSLTEDAVSAINEAINRMEELNNRYYKVIDNSYDACFYYPEFPTEFRGQCPENVPVVQNFDAERYQGKWYDIESYPQTFQQGKCSNANYTLRDGGVDVYNTQVVDQYLDEIIGRAVVASDDGSAKLAVTFPIVGTDFTITTPYWVLATDYVSYSLVYSCMNIDWNTYRVSSWYLSRTKQLSAAASEQIQEVVARVKELDDRYYVKEDQSPEGCFYYPVPTEDPVIMPGQCGLDMPVVNDFNMAQFAGVWHEIEAYPKEQQNGQCINHEFTIGIGNTLNLQSSSISDQSMGITNGVLSNSTIDNNGRMTLTFVSNGITLTIPYWIIATDYVEYAVAYSCVNTADDFRAVYSWKLSRTKQPFSAAANNAINNVINGPQVLDNMYYKTIDQSDDACFVSPNQPTIYPGQCDPSIPVVTNFDAVGYLGRWHLIETYPSGFQGGQCNDAEYTLQNDGSVLVYNTQVMNQTLDTIFGTANVVPSEDGSGKLLVDFDGVSLEYWILATDYVSFSFVYSCRNISDFQKEVYSWKLSRTKSLPDNAVDIINQVVNAVDDLENEKYQIVDNSDDACFYYPEATGEPVVYRGQCDMNINVVQNFDAERYQGRWYEMKKYPQQFQEGTCGTANYNISDGVVNVENTQIVNERLLTILGTAVPESNDGSGKLLATFPVAGTNDTITTRYWVLATDYDNYALVYNCDNIDSEYRRVTSWKLSRTQSLTEEAEGAINQIIEAIPVLDERYYQDAGRNDDNCFYYPEFDELPDRIELNGYCPENIQAIPNFDAAAYLGIWYEVARYPTGDQSSGCPKADYSDGDGVVNVTNTQVIGERLFIQEGYALVVSDDGSGKLEVFFEVNGEDMVANYYVMATDYINYALVYSCRNMSDGNRVVSSWKLSRTRSGLNDTAKEIMNDVIDNTQGLFEEYYTSTGLSDDDCFYYPEYDEPPNAIVFGSPCPESIQAMPNFDAAAYLGTWYEVARYPTGDQSSGCPIAKYSSGDGVVDVLNTQVIGERLFIQEGYALVASDDGAGKLEVFFEVNGEDMVANYYVMATDYINYALVYSCRNMSDGNRVVSSWKLSRTRSGLNDTAKEIMNDVIINTQGLLEEYYTSTGLSDDDCFYIPEVDESTDVVFRGKCDRISGVEDFDLQRYLGWWHEIERFPSAVKPGECTNSRFQASGFEILVEDTSVTDQNGEIASSTVTATSDGRLRRTFSNGQVVDTWVIATDYESYSLLYSCEDFQDEDNNDYRRVWSAKHSKSRQLTNAAQNAMSPTIQNNKVLYPQFYTNVDQRDDACFYYPTPSTRPVVYRGQCDDNIPVVQNFRADEYTGTWYQIERYPQTFEFSSECTGARYSLDEESGMVTLVNWEVINGELDTITGNATVISTDGSAKLQVVLPNRGEGGEATVTTSLFVLTTDYTSHALAYSCENINEHERQVGVWKLSRTRSMPAAGHTAINSYIASRPELNQQYFLTTNQNDDCIEPSSGVLIKSSIILLLVCALTQLLL